MSDVLQIALAGLLTAIQTVLLIWAAHRWPPDDHDGKHSKDD